MKLTIIRDQSISTCEWTTPSQFNWCSIQVFISKIQNYSISVQYEAYYDTTLCCMPNAYVSHSSHTHNILFCSKFNLQVRFVTVGINCNSMNKHLHLNDDSLCIAIDNGKILGSYVNGYEKKVVKQFLGIPYGVAPINDLRFEKPKPYKEKYKSGIFKAMEYGPSCPQVIDKTYRNFSGSTMWNAPNKQSEDCLNLNIWVPHNDTRIYTVMVWIFGGGFTSGTSALSIYNGKYLASQGNVLVVSFNYRIGALGFLKNDKLGLKGNM
ncbi:hypothetical protein A3Q56_00625 [Intoshia linei]|uniref:Carboxylesterase type B domain-containing protein n=1 Tax=Intoshia linei TaxID=1819745 RepID=A0A177BB90_9BILA|nr:hypothetical protein A3Q56_00625 [Intoshia linei]